MKIYIRKLDNQCFSHQISVPKYVRDDFFDGAPNDAELNFKVDGIVVEGGSSDQIVKANFVVKDVNVITSPGE